MTDDPLVDAVKIALIGVDVLETDFGFTEKQAAEWMDKFLTRVELDFQNGKPEPTNN